MCVHHTKPTDKEKLVSKPNVIKIDEVEYVRKDSVTQEVTGDFVIVRCRNAGVHAGTLVHRDANVLELANSRRLWRWWSKFTLSGLAMDGPLESQLDKQVYACVLPKLTLTVSDVCEVIACTAKARDAIMAVPEREND